MNTLDMIIWRIKMEVSKEEIHELTEYLEFRINDWDSMSFVDETDGSNMLEMWITDFFNK